MKHELTYIYADRAHHIGDGVYVGDFYRCTCGKEFQTASNEANGDVLAAFEHGQDTALHPEFWGTEPVVAHA